VSYSQGARLAVRARGNPEDLANPARGAIASVDRRLLVDEVRSFETYLSEVTGREHTTAYLTATLALVGVVLVGVGCALLASSLVAERRGELALRMALGATRGRLFGEVVRRGLLVGGVGVVAGGAATWLFQDFVQRRLFEAGAMSSGSVGIAALTVLAVAVVFTGLPAARLNHVAPSEALKQQSLG
jgi:ABC-type antimicrobial peptide transport system permease subunit